MANLIKKQGTLTFIDYPSKEDWAVIYYFTGCTHCCPMCQNKILKDPRVGQEVSLEEFCEQVINDCKRNKTNKVVLCGGDPLSVFNREFVKAALLWFDKHSSQYFSFCIYTGHSIEEVKEMGIVGADIIKCGTFDHTQAQESGNFNDRFVLASKNQNFYNHNLEKISNDGVLKYFDF